MAHGETQHGQDRAEPFAALAAPTRLAAVLREAPVSPAFAADPRTMREQDREQARDPWAG